MSLARKIEQAAGARPGGLPCSVDVALQSLTPKNRDAFLEALTRPGGRRRFFFSETQLADLLDGEVPNPPSAWSIGHHRRKACHCGNR